MSSAITVILIAFFVPIIIDAAASSNDYNRSNFKSQNAAWYLFLLAFIVFAIIRWREVKRNPSVFDFKKFSLYTGDVYSWLYDGKLFGKSLSDRTIEIFIEPALFIIPGIVLLLIGQSLGYLLLISAFCYGISYAAQYKKGDDFVMDKIDEMILNEELESAFVDDEPADKTRGVRFYAQKPDKKSLRQKLADSFIETVPEQEEITLAN
jgi:hypothetical protein